MQLLKSLFVICGLAVSLTCSAQTAKDTIQLNKPVPHKYKFVDNLFFGGSIGINYSMSEYVREEKFFRMLRPQIDINIGKYMNKYIALRTGLYLMSQEASIPQDVQELMKNYKGYEPYNFMMLGAKADFMFNMNRIFKRYRYDEPFSVWAVGGLEGFRTMGFQKKVKDWDYYYPINYKSKWLGGGHLGLEFQVRSGDHYSLTFAGLWHCTTSSYNGQPLSKGGSRNYVTFDIGFVYRFINSKGEIGFHNCKKHENYYFDVMNRRIDKFYRKYEIEDASLGDTILVFTVRYSYLTPTQRDKLYRLITRMENEPELNVQIDVYSDGDETAVYNNFRAKNRIETIQAYIGKLNADMLQRITITQHEEASPIPSELDWARAGIIHIMKK